MSRARTLWSNTDPRNGMGFAAALRVDGSQCFKEDSRKSNLRSIELRRCETVRNLNVADSWNSERKSAVLRSIIST